MGMGSSVMALGHYAPARRVTNDEIEARLGLEPGWILQRTGIVERRYVAENQSLSDIALEAGEMALSEAAGFDRGSIALLVLATSTPDHLLPPTAPLLAHRLGLQGAGAIDMAGACGGFLYALAFADSFVKTQQRPALVVAANVLSRRTNLQDKSSAILFSDAAGAVLLAPSSAESGVLGLELVADGAGYDLIGISSGGSRKPFEPGLDPVEALMEIRDGQAVFAKVSRLMVRAAEAALARAGLSIGDIDYVVPHQANARIMAAVARELGVPDTKILSSVALFGNSSAATIPFTLSLASRTQALKPGDKILMCAAGAGLTGGAVVFGV